MVFVHFRDRMGISSHGKSSVITTQGGSRETTDSRVKNIVEDNRGISNDTATVNLESDETNEGNGEKTSGRISLKSNEKRNVKGSIDDDDDDDDDIILAVRSRDRRMESEEEEESEGPSFTLHKHQIRHANEKRQARQERLRLKQQQLQQQQECTQNSDSRHIEQNSAHNNHNDHTTKDSQRVHHSRSVSGGEVDEEGEIIASIQNAHISSGKGGGLKLDHGLIDNSISARIRNDDLNNQRMNGRDNDEEEEDYVAQGGGEKNLSFSNDDDDDTENSDDDNGNSRSDRRSGSSGGDNLEMNRSVSDKKASSSSSSIGKGGGKGGCEVREG